MFLCCALALAEITVVSSDETVVTVDGTGVVVPVGSGEATVTWMDDDKLLAEFSYTVDEDLNLTMAEGEDNCTFRQP